MKRVMKVVIITLVACLVVVATSCCPREKVAPTLPATLRSITTLIDNGGRMDWSHHSNLIAFDRKGEDGFYDIYTMKPDGSDQICLTCATTGLPGKHMGWPAWHPSGDYIVLQAEKPVHPGNSIASRPGIGVNTDIWLITRDGSQAFQLTNLPVGTGVLRPVFSRDGSKLLWAQMIEPPPRGEFLGGLWSMKLADFVVDDEPRLQNIRTLQPGGNTFGIWYETHGFNEDDSKIIFTSNLEPNHPVWATDIYTMDLVTEKIERLTASLDQWDEHASYSPSFEKIVWISSMGCDCDPSDVSHLKTDLWIMNADGSNRTRLTHFSDPGYAGYVADQITAADSAWSPDGKKVLVRVFPERTMDHYLNLIPELEPIMMIEFKEPQ